MNTARRSNETGMALLMALSAIVLIGVLIGGIVFVSTQDYRIGGNAVRQTRAGAAAELGLNRIRQDWNLSYNNSLHVGDTLKRTYTAPRGASVNVTVTKVATSFFWVVSEGTAGALGSQATARRRYGSLFRIDSPDIPFMGALTGRGTLLVGGSATVSGKDSVPTGWQGCPQKKDIAGVAMSDTNQITLPGCSVGKNCVDGNPKYLQDPAAGDTSTYFVYGNGTYQSLAATAGVVIPGGQTLNGIGPVVSGGACVATSMNNWGDMFRAVSPVPPQPCETYYPVIHVLGDVRITGGQGQGILLVDGNLEMSGGFTFSGAMVIRGALTTTGTGAHVTGAVMAAAVNLDQNSVLGNSSIRYSSCALGAAMNGTAYIKPAKQRAWVDVY